MRLMKSMSITHASTAETTAMVALQRIATALVQVVPLVPSKQPLVLVLPPVLLAGAMTSKMFATSVIQLAMAALDQVKPSVSIVKQDTKKW